MTTDSLRTRKLYPAPAPLAYCKHGKLLKKHMNVTKAAVIIQNNINPTPNNRIHFIYFIRIGAKGI